MERCTNCIPGRFEPIFKLTDAVSRGSRRSMGHCPAHPDRHRSLSLRVADDGRLLVHCFRGCTFDEICKAANLDLQTSSPARLHLEQNTHGWLLSMNGANVPTYCAPKQNTQLPNVFASSPRFI